MLSEITFRLSGSATGQRLSLNAIDSDGSAYIFQDLMR